MPRSSSTALPTPSPSATPAAWQRSCAREARADAELAPLLLGLAPELKHAYPTRLLLSLVRDLCDEVAASAPVEAKGGCLS